MTPELQDAVDRSLGRLTMHNIDPARVEPPTFNPDGIVLPIPRDRDPFLGGLLGDPSAIVDDLVPEMVDACLHPERGGTQWHELADRAQHLFVDSDWQGTDVPAAIFDVLKAVAEYIVAEPSRLTTSRSVSPWD